MINHSMVFDDFFTYPDRVRDLINKQELKDRLYSDGVTYPDIAELPESIRVEIRQKIKLIFGPMAKEVLSFARYSFGQVTPPHWAHSDRNIAQFLGLIYLNKDREEYGTCLLKHKNLKFETHPQHELQRYILLGHANKKEEWDVTFEFPARFNRMVILNADLIHASLGGYGSTKEDGRLVISFFFNCFTPAVL